LVVPFVPFGCSSRSTLHFHKNILDIRAICYFNSIVRFPSVLPQSLHNTKKNKAVPQKAGQSYFSAVRSSSSHALFLRSVGLMHPQYRFIPLHSFVCLSLHCIALPAALNHFTPFQQYHVCRPLFFQRWRSSPSHRGLAPLSSLSSLEKHPFSIINYPLSIIN